MQVSFPNWDLMPIFGLVFRSLLKPLNCHPCLRALLVAHVHVPTAFAVI